MDLQEPDESGTFTLKIKSKSDEHEGTQKKTFTKWLNSQLAKAGSDERVVNLFEDLRDGTTLLTLMEILSGKKIKRERGHMRVHHLNNVNNVMTALEKYNIKLVNISNNDIVDGNPKITLGLLWNIISHFQLLHALQALMTDFKGTPEEALLQWCRMSTKEYNGVRISNFTTSWKDGLAFNALIHRYRPDLVKYDSLVGKSGTYNCENAFNIARDKLGVDRLLDPEDVVRDRPDKKSIMMYVAMLYSKLSPNAGLTTSGALSVMDSNGILSTRDPYQRTGVASSTTHSSRMMQRTEVSSTVKRTVTSSYSASSSEQKRIKSGSSTTNGDQQYITSTESSYIRDKPVQHMTVESSSYVRGKPSHMITESSSYVRGKPSHTTTESSSYVSGKPLRTTTESFSYLREKPSRTTTESSSYVREKPVKQTTTTVVEHVLERRPDSFYDSDSIRNSVGSFRDSESNRDSMGERDWEDYNSQLKEVLSWLSKAEAKLKSQPAVSRNVDIVKDQFHDHEDFMMELTSHQTSVGGVLEYGNQLISEGLVSEKEENDIRDQMITLNERWEALRISAMERQTSLHENLMKLQQQQIDQLAKWLDKAEARIEAVTDIGNDIDTVKKKVEEHKVFQEDLESQQKKVNSLTHMVVVVDDSAGENTTAELEEQLAQLGERWSSVCKWTEQRWTVLQDVLGNWQEYRDEERRLSKWLSEKENQISSLKHVDLNDPDAIKYNLQRLIAIEQELEAQQATFGTFNMAAERVAEHMDEDSPGVDAIQDRMEEFNDQWNSITTEVSNRIALLKGLESKVQPFQSEIDEKTIWLNETEATLKSPRMNFDNDKMSSDELSRQYITIEALENAKNQRRPSVLAIQKKGEEITDQIRAQGTIPVAFEHKLKTFIERWEAVCKLIDDKKHKASLARQRREVVDLSTKVETVLKEVERSFDRLGGIPDNEYEIKTQIDQCKNKRDDLFSNERHLIKLKDVSNKLSKDDRQTPIFQMSVKRLDERWTSVSSKLDDRERQLTSTLESGPPKEYLNTMDTVLMSIKTVESKLGGDFQITEDYSLEDEIQKYKQAQVMLQEQKKNIDYLNTAGEKFMKTLPRQKLEQLRQKLNDVNNKWKDVSTAIERRQTQAQKGINQNKQFADELKELNKWMAEVGGFLKDQEPAAGDPDTLEAQLDQSEALQSDITKLQRKLDSLNETGTYMLTKASPPYAQKVRSQLDDVTIRWDTLVRHAGRVKDNLLAALEKYQKLNHDMKEMSHWIMQTERSIADDDRDIAAGEITREKMDHYKELQQDVSKRAPVVVRINTTANQLADHTKQGSAKPLVENLKKLNSDWSRLKNKVAQRQHEFKITQSELEQFNIALQRDHKLISEIDKVAERSYDSLEGTETSIEEALRALNRHLTLLKMSGPGSVVDIANQLINKKISITMVTRQRDEFVESMEAMKNRAERTRQVLEGELNKRLQMKRDLETIKTWITKIEVLITTRINKYEEIDERELKTLNDEFSSNENLLVSVERACRDLSNGPNGSIYASHLRELDQLKTKWTSIQTKFTELKDQPVRKLGAEFEALVGDLMSRLDKIHRNVKKLKLVSGEPRIIKNLQEQCKSYKEELVTTRKDLDHVRKVGQQIADKSPDDKRSGIERRIEEVQQEHKELVNKVNKKYEDFTEALTLAGRIENDLSRLETWLDKTRKEAKRRVDAGFPDDVDEEIKWNKTTIKEVTGRLSEVQRLTEVGRELVDLSETGQLESLEDRLTRLNNTWEDLSSLLEHRLTLLPKYKTQIKDFEKLVDQLNSWLDKMSRELNALHTEQPEIAKEKLELLKEEVHKHEPQFQLIQQNSNEFVSNGRNVMEPYRRLLDRRWEDLEAKISDLEEELDSVKKSQQKGRVDTEVIVKERKMISRPGVTEEYVRTEELVGSEAGVPMFEETITTRRTYPVSDDIEIRLERVITEVKELEELLMDIERPRERRTASYEVTDKIQQAERKLDSLQPRVETILKESKTVTSRDSPGSDTIRHSLLDLSGRWLKACDEVDRNKRAVKIVPNWYQFRSHLEEINNSLKKYEADDRPERYVKDLSAEELEEHRRKYGLMISDIEKLDKEGIQIISPLEANRIKRRLREINSRFEQYKKPKDDVTSYRVVVHTGDVKDADTRANVSFVVYGDKGRSSPEIKLDKSETYVTPFRRDQLDIFNTIDVRNLGELTKIKIWHDNSGPKPAWYVKSIYVQDRKSGKVYHFDCNTWIGKEQPGESKDLKCSGYIIPEEGEDIFTRQRLANVRWVTTYLYSSPKKDKSSIGWSLVEDMSKLSDEVREIDNTLNSSELKGADYEDFSNQEDKLKFIGEKMENIEARASDVFNRSETLTHEQCTDDREYDAVRKSASKLRLDWNNLNKDYKMRMVRWEKALTVWRSFHCDLKDLTSWLNRVERILADTKMPNGDLNVDAAMSEQRSLEDGISTHESMINSVNNMGDEIVRQSNAMEAKMLRDKVSGINKRWKVVVAEVDDRKNRFKEEEMQIQAFMDESGDLLQWMDETDAVLKQKEAPSADERALKEQLKKIKEAEAEIEVKDDSVKSIKETGERLLTRTIFSKPNHDMVRTRLDLVMARWEILRMDGLTRRRAVENKLNRLTTFVSELEELSLWASTTRDLLETQASLKDAGSTDGMIVDPKTVHESLRARQQTLDNVNETMTVLRRDSKIESASVPKPIENKVKLLNEDWARIATQASTLFANRTKRVHEDVIVSEVNQKTESSIDGGWDTRDSPWPKFDKAVSELHVWLDDVTDMMKTEKIVLSDSEEIFALAEKQKSVDEQLKSKQHLRDEIAEMGHSLSEEAENHEDKMIIDRKVSKLKEHWENVQEKSTVWRGQIDYLLEEWKRYVELREELVEWLRKAEAYLKKDENPYNYTVSDLDEQINKHKGFEEDLETWRGSITAVTQCGENLIQEFPTHEASALRHNMSELKERWENVKAKSDARHDNLKDAFERMVRFHEEMINALTWLTTTESRVAELDSSIDAGRGEDREHIENLKYELKDLEEDINSHQEMFASLNENGQHMITEMEPGDVLTAVQTKLDDINDRWQTLNVRTLEMRDRLEETATEWRQLLLDLQEIMEWIKVADQELTSQQPIGGDLDAVQTQNETHQAFKGKLNVRRLMVDRVLDSGRRMMDEYHGERAAGEAEGSSRSRIAANIVQQLSTVDDQWSKLCHRSEEWQINVDENLRKFQVLDGQMEDVDVRLTEAEQASVTWTPVQDLVIDSLHEQMEELKTLQERIAHLQQMFENMSNTEGELRRRGVTFSANLQNRIDQLYRRWKQLQIQMLQRQNALQDAYPEGDSTSLQALQASVEPPWERAVAVNKVPYYINHKTETTQWDHPKMTELYHQIAELNDIKYSAYRTAMKLRCIQRATSMDLVTLENLDNAFDAHGLKRINNNALIGIREMVDTLATVYENIEVGQENISSAICIDLTLNWLLNVYDSGRIGKIRLLSFKVGLVTMCRALLEDKYKYLFRLVADNDGHMDHKQLGLLLHDSLQIPRQLGEIAAFGGSNIEPSVRSCFEKVGAKDRIDAPQFLHWLSAEPQSIVWLPTLHRLAASEAVKHKAKCNICKEYPIVGFRFRCLKCFNYDLCQSCFWSGRVSHDHRLTHPMHQYCLSTTSGEDVKDFLSIVRNKFKKRQYKKNPPRKLGYLPIQTVMEGGNLETPPNPSLQQNVNNEVHNRLGMYAHRLAEAETNGDKYSPKQLDEEHQLIAQYCQSLKNDNTEAPRSPTQIVMSLDADEKDDLESEINKLEDENRALQEEYERLKAIRDEEHPSEGDSSPGPKARDAELLTEAKLLRQHKGRLEARMQVLEDHNRQLEAQLQRLRQLLDQPNQENRSPPAYSRGTTPASSASSLGDPPYGMGRSATRSPRPRGLESDTESDQGRNASPVETRKTQDPVSDLFNTAHDVNKAVENLVQVMTDDETT